MQLPPTIIFDYPTLNALAVFAQETVGDDADEGFDDMELGAGPTGADIFVVGVGCRFPASTDDPMACINLLMRGGEGAKEIPLTRFDVDRHFMADFNAMGSNVMFLRHAAFIEGNELFDAGFFSVSPKETVSMDPQQRNVLQTSAMSFVGGGMPIKSLMRTSVAVVVGTMMYDWMSDPSVGKGVNKQTLAGSGYAPSIMANRASFIFGVDGPSVQFDTACSSSLVNTDVGIMALRRGRAIAALCVGTNQIISPQPIITMSMAQMLAVDGHCKTYDNTCNGFGRGEGTAIFEDAVSPRIKWNK